MPSNVIISNFDAAMAQGYPAQAGYRKACSAAEYAATSCAPISSRAECMASCARPTSTVGMPVRADVIGPIIGAGAQVEPGAAVALQRHAGLFAGQREHRRRSAVRRVTQVRLNLGGKAFTSIRCPGSWRSG